MDVEGAAGAQEDGGAEAGDEIDEITLRVDNFVEIAETFAIRDMTAVTRLQVEESLTTQP